MRLKESAQNALHEVNHKASSTIPVVVLLIGLVNCTTGAHNLVIGSQGESVIATSGTPQSHTINGTFALPLAVTVTKNGSPASAVVVTFAAPSLGASGKFVDTGAASTTSSTDSNGVATSAAFIANGKSGTYTVTASAQGAQAGVTFSLTNTSGAPATILATTGSVQSAVIDSTYASPLVVDVVDSDQNPVQFAMVAFTAPTSGASGTFADTGTNITTATTDANGVATSTAFTANSTAGPDTVTATVAGVSTPATFNLTNVAGSQATITAISGTPQKAAIGTHFSAPLAARVLDSFSNPVSGAAVTFSAPTTTVSGTFSNGTANETDTTDANGVATSSVFSANVATGGPYTVTASVSGVATPADFSLTNTLPFETYVFSVSGEELNTTGFYALAGAVQIDTSGNVLAGEQDYNDGPSGITSPEPSGDVITGGTLKVNSSGLGTLVLNTNNSLVGVEGTESLGVQFVNAKHALIIQFDGTAASSGSIDLQTLPTTLSGGFAFAINGVDPGSAPVAFGGVFTISGGTSLQNGAFDTNDAGIVTTASALTGTVSAPDSFGRGMINSTINYTSLAGSPAPVVLNYYLVGPEVLRIIDVDSVNNGNTTSDAAMGSAFGQGLYATAASNASLGSSVFGVSGSNLSEFAATGMFSTNSSPGTFSGVADDDELTNAIQLPASPISGTYSIASNGYGSLKINSGTLGDVNVLGVYLTDPNLNLSDPNNTSTGLGGALVVDMDPVLAGGVGILIPQTGTSIANFAGKYAFAGHAFTTSGEFDFVGRGNVTNGTLSGSGIVSDPFLTFGALAMNNGVSFGGTPLADASNPGRYTLSVTDPTPNPLRIVVNGVLSKFDVAIYQASGGQLFWLNVDASSVFLGSLQQQGSLKGVPLTAVCCSGTVVRPKSRNAATPDEKEERPH